MNPTDGAGRRGRGKSSVGESTVPYDATPTEGPGRVERRLSDLVDTWGNNRIAELLGVSRSQPSRWRGGQERISPANRVKIIDLDYILTRLLEEFELRVADIWLRSPNPHLGARPIDVLLLRGPEEVIEALNIQEAGGYA